MIRLINCKDYFNFILFCENRDSHSDFYVTKDNKRLFLTDRAIARKVFNDCIKHGDKAYAHEEAGQIKGILLITGFADKFDRKYIKLFATNHKTLEGLLRVLIWNVTFESFLKIKKDNPIGNLCRRLTYNENGVRKYYFTFLGNRGNEILLKFTPSKAPNFPKFYKQEDEE